MTEITIGSLFSGSGGFELAASICGIKPIWASEIEPLPILVTKKNFPEMKHLGDIGYVKGDKIDPVTIISGGSPCQDMSIAGQRAGLDGDRSGLFRQQIRIVKEMRNSDIKKGRTGKDIRPRFMVWENVPGAFSSNRGGATSGQYSRRSQASQTKQPQYLSLRKTNGQKPDASWAILSPLLGERLMPNTGESPKEESESSLSQILEEAPHQKYFLSAKACAGILKRAEKRGRELPGILREALMRQAEIQSS